MFAYELHQLHATDLRRRAARHRLVHEARRALRERHARRGGPSGGQPGLPVTRDRGPDGFTRAA